MSASIPTNISSFARNCFRPKFSASAFPEFGWRRDAQGWVATNYEHTKAQFGVRADRVVAHALPLLPRGLYIHGEDRMVLWTEYVNGGVVPRGADFIRAVKEIAERAGVDPSRLDRAQPRDRRSRGQTRWRVLVPWDEYLVQNRPNAAPE